ncbi:hypothetical protein GIB67_031875 [Kingdonia uniflora]|uniref:Uncharacterized protein n=1 Tax=Kingdonia uniflora TaxID=39325 RepID=A0A7J7LGY0_9MAGN|nr:hypothetical protein GIB67_031875 [Kingdonia uniflora]
MSSNSSLFVSNLSSGCSSSCSDTIRRSNTTLFSLSPHHLPFLHGRSISLSFSPLQICKTSLLNLKTSIRPSPQQTPFPPFHPHYPQLEHHSNGGNNGPNGPNNNNGNNNNNEDDDGHGDDNSNGGRNPFDPSFSFLLFFLLNTQLAPALARTATSASGEDDKSGAVWEVRGGKWIKLLPNPSEDEFVPTPTSESASFGDLSNLWRRCSDIFLHLMLPEGYPDSVTSDYMEYSLWRGVQGVASQISGVLATQALLYAVGLGKGAIPVAAAINWVLKDGLGYLSKILLSKYGRHFDVNPKGWRLFADLLENAAFGLEILTPAFPQHFVLIGAVAGAGRSAGALIQAATRSCFFAGFAAQRNFAEVIAKGEAQGMVSKFIGIALGIAIANCIGSSTPLSLATFSVVTWIHMYCNLKSYQAILIRTLNPYRASLVFSEYLLSGQVPPIKEVNDDEPLFPAVPLINVKLMNNAQSELLSVGAKAAAVEIERRLQMGSKLSEVIDSKEDVFALFNLYNSESYILTEHRGKFCVVLKEGYSPQDMFKSLFQVNYLYWLEKNVGIESRSAADDCKPGGKLQISLDYAQRELNHVKNDGALAGWITDGLIARPLPNRIRLGYAATS